MTTGLTFASMGLPLADAGKGVNARHREWIERANIYYHIDLLAAGGYKIKTRPDWFLEKRYKEPIDVFQMRLTAMTYQNLIGSAIGWYAAAMFREEWSAQFKDGDNALDPKKDSDNFYLRWVQNVDKRGNTFNSFLGQLFESQLKYQSGWILVDKPNLMPTQFANRAQQTAAGANDPYCVLYEPASVINWDTDEFGNLRWAVIWTTRKEAQFREDPKLFDRWTYYDTKQYTMFEALRPADSGAPDDSKAVQVADGPHALAEVGRVPLRRCGVPDLYWLSDRAYPQAIDHLNLDNAYKHILMMANLPIPAVFGDYEEKPAASVTTLNHFDKDTRFEWLEPKGTSYTHSAARLSQLREEVYRQFYLQAQGKDSKAVAAASSGYSKEMEWIPANDVLSKYAHGLRSHGELIIRDVADARGDTSVKATVSGTEFGEPTTAANIATLELMDQADIPSDTLEKVVQKQVAKDLSKDEPDEVQQQICKEIDDAPKKSERAAQQEAQQQNQFAQTLQKGFDRRLAADISEPLAA